MGAGQEKGHSDRLLPMAPEFAAMLAKVPEAERTGPVFKLPGLRATSEEVRSTWVGRIISKIGKKAGVRVSADAKSPEKMKFASAHDLRRAFGERWAARVMPAVLKELMRHESIETTLRYYVGTNAARTADVCWEAFEAARGALPSHPVVEKGGVFEPRA